MLSIISSDFLQDVTQDRKTKVHFIKLHVPWEVLLFYAEELSFRAPLEVCTICFDISFYDIDMDEAAIFLLLQNGIFTCILR